MDLNKIWQKINLKLNFWLAVILGVIIFTAFLFNLFFLNQANSSLDEKIAAVKEAARPAVLEIIMLAESSCQDCSSPAAIIDLIKQTNVKINSEETLEISTAAGQELIKKYNIDKVPALLVFGELEKEARLQTVWKNLGEIQDDTFILRKTAPPYVLTTSGEVVGRVKLTMLMDRQCSQCYDVTLHQNVLTRFGIFTQDQEVIELALPAAQELVEKYQIELVPTIILTGDVEVYNSLKEVWPQVGTVEEDGAYVLRQGVSEMGTYKNLTTKEVVETYE